jgi:hypothetical protein
MTQRGRDGRDQDRAANQDCNQPQQEQAARWGRVRQSAHCPLCPAEEAGQPHMPVAQGGRPKNLDACPLAAVQASPRLPPAECCCCCPRWSQLDTWTRGRPDLLDSQLRDHSSFSSPSRLLPSRTLFLVLSITLRDHPATPFSNTTLGSGPASLRFAYHNTPPPFLDPCSPARISHSPPGETTTRRANTPR